MKNNFFKFFLALIMMVGVLVPAIPASATVSCPTGSARSGQSVDSYAECSTPETSGDDSLMSRVKVIINVVIGLIGVAAVAMIIIGGITYTTSQGDPAKVKQGKDIILYSVIGLVVALLAFAIVNFVLQNVFK